MSKDVVMNKEYEEMISKIKIDKVFSVVLKKGGSTHNILVKEMGNKNIFGNVAIERIMVMFDRKGQPKCEFCFYEDARQVESNKDINVIEATRTFISLPRIVIVPYENIGLVEEGPFPYLESLDSIGLEINMDDNIVLEKFSMFRPYYSKQVGGFYQNPVLIKGMPSGEVYPFKVVNGDNKFSLNRADNTEAAQIPTEKKNNDK